MASIIKLNGKYRAQVRRTGQPTMTQTFEKEQDAKDWATKEENNVIAGRRVGVHGMTGITLADAIDRFNKENKNLGVTHTAILRYLREGLGSVRLDKMTDQDIVNYIQKKGFGKMAGSMHFSFLSGVLKMAKVGWNYHVPEILEHARDRLKILGLIGSSKARDRRPTEQEIKMLLEHDYRTSVPMADIIQFAIATAMRQAEITRIKFSTFEINDQAATQEVVNATIIITDRKHPSKKKGNHKIVPLLDSAIEIIKRQPNFNEGGFVFPYTPHAVGECFRRACKALGIDDLHFHDLRHEGTSRLFEMGYKIEEVAMYTGHEDWKMLQRYTHLKPSELRSVKQTAKVPQTPMVAIHYGEDTKTIVMDADTIEEFKKFQRMKKMMEETETV